MKNWAKERLYNKKDVAQKRRQVHQYDSLWSEH